MTVVAGDLLLRVDALQQLSNRLGIFTTEIRVAADAGALLHLCFFSMDNIRTYYQSCHERKKCHPFPYRLPFAHTIRLLSDRMMVSPFPLECWALEFCLHRSFHIPQINQYSINDDGN